MTARLLALSLLIPLVVGSTGPERAFDSSCTIEIHPFTVYPWTTYFLATPRSDTLPVGNGEADPSQTGGHLTTSIHDRRVYGQVFDVEAIAGAEAPRVARAIGLRPHSWQPTKVAVAVWDYDAGCEPAKWGESFAWAPTGQRTVLLADLRPDSLWVDGIPTFDAFYGGRIYPPLWWGYARAQAPSTVFTLLRTLPDFCLFHTDPQTASARLDSIAERYPDAVATQPGKDILAVRRDWAHFALTGDPYPMFERNCAP